MEVLGGTAGWSYDDWVGPFYPADAPKGFSRLAFYSGFFDCVEVDSTFYRHFPPGVAEKWLSEVEGNPGFTFLIKLYRSFTHGGRDNNGEPEVDAKIVLDFLQPIAEARKLGGLLVQFSEYFRESPLSRDRILSIAERFHGIQLFFELRHTSWYTEKGAEFLRENGISVVAVDQPALKGMVGLTPDVVGEVGYFRLHGRNEKMWGVSRKNFAEKRASGISADKDNPGRNDRYNYLYNNAELDEIERKIRSVGERCTRVYIVANNHPMGKAVANALELVRRLRDQEKVRVPDTIIKYFPELELVADRVEVSRGDSLF